MSGSIHKTAVVIDAMNFRRAGVESFLTAWAQYEDVDLISIPPELARETLGEDMDCRMMIYNAGGAPFSSPGVLAEINELHMLRPSAALVVVTDDASLDSVSAAINAGAQGYLDNSMRPALALLALSFVLRGGTYFPPTAILNGRSAAVSLHHSCGASNGQRGIPAYSGKRCDNGHVEIDAEPSSLIGSEETVAKTAQPQMTARQEAVISCLCGGDSNKVIARKLGMTETTVKVHVREVMRKLGVSNRTQVAIFAARNGLGSRGVADLLYQDASDGDVSSRRRH
jgi:DNA-binding NarL/FixJ family response regulator